MEAKIGAYYEKEQAHKYGKPRSGKVQGHGQAILAAVSPQTANPKVGRREATE